MYENFKDKGIIEKNKDFKYLIICMHGEGTSTPEDQRYVLQELKL